MRTGAYDVPFFTRAGSTSWLPSGVAADFVGDRTISPPRRIGLPPRWTCSDRRRVSSSTTVADQRAHTTIAGDVHPRVCASGSKVVPTYRPARASCEDALL